MPLLLPLLALLPLADPVVHHDVTVRLDVRAGQIEVVDRVTVPAALLVDGARVRALLHAGLHPTASAGVALALEEERGHAVPAERLWLSVPESAGGKQTAVIDLRYRGPIGHAPRQLPGEQQRDVAETPGVISEDGVYLSPSALWLPHFEGARDTANIRIEGLPAGWTAIGEGSAPRIEEGAVRFESTTPSLGLHLIAGRLTSTTETQGGVTAMVLLRAADPALSARYLEATRQYLSMYTSMLGPYPYPKHAVVENFWETGYGMPSFTLLGPRVIRFPFILTTSFPHEVLHNWWGNGVFLDERAGNWTEGLTTYLADHLAAEQRGQGAEHRRSTLTRYADFVRTGSEQPLARFAGRSSQASEAVGYGKASMMFHMLRRQLGDDRFLAALRRFFEDHRFQQASFDDLRRAFEQESGQELGAFFTSWTTRTGAPSLAWREARVAKSPAGRVTMTLELAQTQREEPFPVTVPVVVTLASGGTHVERVPMADRSTRVVFDLPSPPARLDVDPGFDVFRRLSAGEVAPQLSRALGAEGALFVLPSLASDEERLAWRGFAAALCAPAAGSCQILVDKAVKDVPADRAVWILGYGNALRAAAALSAKRHGARFDDRGFQVDGARVDTGRSSVALALTHPRGSEAGAVFVAADNLAAIAGLARKLPHYGKYGWLVFAGSIPENAGKGQWESSGSPLTVAWGAGAPPQLALPPASPLAPAPPIAASAAH